MTFDTLPIAQDMRKASDFKNGFLNNYTWMQSKSASVAWFSDLVAAVSRLVLRAMALLLNFYHDFCHARHHVL